MAHEISIKDGKAEAAYAIQPAWHKLGQVLDHYPTSAEMIKAAHLDWTVDMQKFTTEGGSDCGDYRAVVRGDTREVLGVVSDRYASVQNEKAFEFLDSLSMDGVIRYESAMALKGGRIVVLLARMPSIDEIAQNDNALRYILFQTSHDGSMKLHAIPTSVRVVCMNTLRLAVQGVEGIRHMGNMELKLKAVRNYLSQFDKKFTLFRDNARRLAEMKVNSEQAFRYVESLFPAPNPESGKRLLNNHTRRVNAVRSNFHNERNAMPGIEGTWWGLYNAVSEQVDHGTTRYGGADLDTWRQNRFLSLTSGQGADLKDRAYHTALQMAGVAGA